LIDTGNIDKSTLLESSIIGEIRGKDVSSLPYGEAWKGYFVPS
jgi:hypothetical protein